MAKSLSFTGVSKSSPSRIFCLTNMYFNVIGVSTILAKISEFTVFVF